MTSSDKPVPPFVIGHEWALGLLRADLAADRMAQAYLFCGPPRIGKTTLALYVARALDCTAPDHRPCGVCSACQRIGRNSYPDVRLLDAQGTRIKIEQIRDIQQDLALSPFEGRWKVHILCGFHDATPEAANCLLKTLEEPPRRAVLILTAADCEGLLPTIVSRCQVFQLRPLPLTVVEHALRTYWDAAPAQASMLSRLSEGRVGWAIEACASDALLQTRDKYLLALEQAVQQGIVGRIGLAQQLGQAAATVYEMLELWQVWWRDVLMAKCGLDQLITNVDRREIIAAEARRFSLGQILTSLQSVQTAGEQVEQNVNPALALEALFLGFPKPSIRSS